MTEETDLEDGAEAAPERPPMAAWKKAVVALSLVLGIVGVASGGASMGDPASTSGRGSASTSLPVSEDMAVARGARVDPGAAGASSLTAADPTSTSATSAGGAAEPAGFTAGGSAGGTIIIGDGSTPTAPEAAPLWAPVLAKGGLSFFVAFCVGYALRTFLKGTMLVIGVVALAIFGLQKAGILGEIDWAVARGHWDDLTAGIGRQFESLRTFVTGSLPSAGSAGLGLVAGFRR
ncbi:MAG: hypothetical protein VX460_06430 [Planctomycetota bacterium]|nr:hypothetical protein [Planctomycetota bacterium]